MISSVELIDCLHIEGESIDLSPTTKKEMKSFIMRGNVSVFVDKLEIAIIPSSKTDCLAWNIFFITSYTENICVSFILYFTADELITVHKYP